eukprot:2733564-Rhodomonas_salina.4
MREDGRKGRKEGTGGRRGGRGEGRAREGPGGARGPGTRPPRPARSGSCPSRALLPAARGRAAREMHQGGGGCKNRWLAVGCVVRVLRQTLPRTALVRWFLRYSFSVSSTS